MTPERMTAPERRQSVLDAAVVEFAKGGLAGTSTEAIAARAGISQPYLFRLFPTKKALFIATVEACFGRVERSFTAAAAGMYGEAALEAMGMAYQDVLNNRTVLLAQLQTYAACDDDDVRAAAREGFSRLWHRVQELSGAPDDRLQIFFAMGMLTNVAVAMGLNELTETWAEACLPPKHRVS
ncbi:MAG TPA: TetR/AcrR family transcriptional regulator [Acidimicrobiales bacterium]|nr:TetR/AcrR family transcriptional regulator [Acidimicrobiales bacterium]